MAASSQDVAIGGDRLTRALIYAALILFAVYFLLPLFVMLVNSFKPLDEIRAGRMLALPQVFTVEPWYYNHDENVSVFVEDVILVTVDGHENLTADLPRRPDELEAMTNRK